MKTSLRYLLILALMQSSIEAARAAEPTDPTPPPSPGMEHYRARRLAIMNERAPHVSPAASEPTTPTPTSSPSPGVEHYRDRMRAIDEQRAPHVSPASSEIATTSDPGVKPSEWRSRLKLSPDGARALGRRAKEQIRAFGRGLKTAAFPDFQSGNGLADAALNMNALPAASLAFAVSLMGAAAINAQLYPGTNPLAIDHAHDLIFDEVTWIGMSGFILTNNFILARPAAAAALQGPLYKAAPTFGMALALGSLVHIGIMEFANDPDVKACIGFSNYHQTGNPVRDWAACDRAWKVSHLRDIASRVFVDQFLPTAAFTLASGSLFYAGLVGLGKVLPVGQITSRLTAAAGGSSAAGFGVRLAAAAGLNALFQAVFEEKSRQFYDEVAKYRQAKYSVQRGTYAVTIDRAERDLLISWTRLAATRWANPNDTTKLNSGEVCYDDGRVGAKYFECGTKGVDFEGALETFEAQHTAWRERILAKTRGLHEQWKQKVSGYHELYTYTRGFYQRAVAKIVYSLQHPQAPASDPKVFNLANLDVNTHTNWLPDVARSFFYWISFIDSKDGPFRYVATPNLNEYLFASLACGPEVEGQSVAGPLGRITDLFRRYGRDDLPAQRMISNEKGRKVAFAPPRIVDSNDGENVCDREVHAATMLAVRTASPLLKLWKSDVANFEIQAGTKKYVGLPSYILDHVRDTVVAKDLNGDPNRLSGWWNDFVLARDAEVNSQLANEYQEVVDKFFRPALINPKYFFCGTHPASAGTGLEEYLYRLGGVGEVCGTSRTHRLADGVINELRDQARLYTAMIMDLYIANAATFDPSSGSASRTKLLNSVLTPARRMLETYDKFAARFAYSLDAPMTPGATEELAEAYKEFLAIVRPAGSSPASPGPNQHQREWMDQLTGHLNHALATLTSYVQLAALPRVGGMN